VTAATSFGTMQAEIESLQRVYAALNANDIDAVMREFDPNIVWMEPWDPPMGGTWRGIDEVAPHFARSRNKWAEGRCEAYRFVPAGEKVVVFIDVNVRLEGENEFRTGRHASVYTFRGGKAVEQRIFEDEGAALAFAGVRS